MHATEMKGFAADIESEMVKIEWCDLMIWQFPLWGFGLPAVLKGWVDRVFAKGRTYDSGRRFETGVFRGKQTLLSLTTGGSEGTYRNEGSSGDINGILRPIHRSLLRFFGFEVLGPQIVYAPARMTHEQRTQQLTNFAVRLRRIGEESPIDVGSY